MAGPSIRARLRRDAPVALLYLVGLIGVFRAAAMTSHYGIAWDAHAYYEAWPGGLYDHPPGTLDAYNYSPLFAQVLWPLTQLPWPVFATVCVGAGTVGMLWLLRPVRLVLGIPLLMAFSFDVVSGNIFWLLAVTAVLGLHRGAPWCVAAFTKVLPCLGPVWFAVRGEWRPLGRFLAVTAVLFTASFALDPALWHQWLDFLTDNAGSSPGLAFVPPLVVRLPLALVVLVVGARTDRAWLLPVAMVLASPVVGTGTLALLASIPRLWSALTPAGVPASPAPAEHGTVV